MIAGWSVCALLASAFGASAAPLQDDPLVAITKEIIADVNDYLVTHQRTELGIPPFGELYGGLALIYGAFGNLSTIVLQEGSSITKTEHEDNSTVYVFKLKLGLQELLFHYKFLMFSSEYIGGGTARISVQGNTAELTGYTTVHSNHSCNGVLLTVKAVSLEDLQIEVTPNSAPAGVSEEILSCLEPYLLDLSNEGLLGALLKPNVQQLFSEFTCKKITSS